MDDKAQVVPFADLPTAALVVDQLYAGGTAGTLADDPLARLLPVGNQGGFRGYADVDAVNAWLSKIPTVHVSAKGRI